MNGELLVVGCSHRTAPLELRESLAFAPDQVLQTLRLAGRERVLTETLILSTCHRTEFYSLSTDGARAEVYVREMIARVKGSDLLGPGPCTYAYRDRDTVRHLMRVAAGLDSAVVGEAQILGQVKDAYNMAREGGSAGAFLDRLLAAAIHAGKRAHSETEIGSGSVSFTSATVSLTKKIFRDLSDKRVLIVGAGEFGRLAAEHFAEERPAALLIANRTRERAEALAAHVGGEAFGLDEVPALLRRADVVVSAVHTDRPVVGADSVRQALRDRSGRTMVFADLGVPRNIDPAVSRLDNVFLYTLESLQTIVDQNLARRRREVPRVEAIVEEELERFFQSVRALQVTPVVRELRDRFESIRALETEKHLKRFAASDRAAVEALTRSIVNKLLHLPTTKIREIDVASEKGILRLDAVREVFGMNGDKMPSGGTDPLAAEAVGAGNADAFVAAGASDGADGGPGAVGDGNR